MQVKRVLTVLAVAVGVIGVAQFAPKPEVVKLESGREVTQQLIGQKRWDAVLGDACDMLANRDATLGPQTVALMLNRQVTATPTAISEATNSIVEVCQRGPGWLATGEMVPAAPAPEMVPAVPTAPALTEVVTQKIAASPEVKAPRLLKTFGAPTMIRLERKTIVAKDAANCRVMPSLDHEVVKRFDPGTKVLVNAKVNGFFHNGVDGCWIHASQF